MSSDLKDFVLPIQKKIQEEASTSRAESRAQFDELKEQMRKQRRDIAGILVMMKEAAGIFDERMTTIEQRVGALEQRQRVS